MTSMVRGKLDFGLLHPDTRWVSKCI